MAIQRRRKKINKKAESVARSVKERKRRTTHVEFFSSGSTTINMALSGHPEWGWPRARVSNIVGDGSSGKTLLALEAAFWFLKNAKKIKSKIFPRVETAKVVYNNGEGVMDFPLTKMYGKKFEKAIDWRRSPTIESVGRDYISEVKDLKRGESLLYIIDSWDQFKSVHDTKISDTTDEDMLKGYKLKKQQFAWKFFSEVCDGIDRNSKDATLIVISQTKQKIGVTFGKKKYRTGGDALNFYTHLVPWIREIEKLKKTRKKEMRIYGIHGEIKVDRSKVSKPFRQSEFRLLFDHGLDNVGSMAVYLKKHKYMKWSGISLKDIHAFSVAVEEQGLEKKLSRKVAKIWLSVEEEFEKELNQRKRKSL
jgi:recombination protein RecA